MSTKRVALVDGEGKIVNVVTLDDESDWAPPDGLTAVEDRGGQSEPGGSYVDGAFNSAPKEPIAQERIDSLTRRQFFLQLEISGLTSKVSAWVASQPKLLQIAFNESGSFKRDEPAMQAGFAALGFTPEQITAFFENGSKL